MVEMLQQKVPFWIITITTKDFTRTNIVEVTLAINSALEIVIVYAVVEVACMYSLH